VSDSPVQAAYGHRIVGIDTGRWLGAHGVEDWPTLQVDRERALPAYPGIRIDADRGRATIAADLADDEFVHPVLARAALMLAPERGLDAMHAGAIGAPDGAWAVVGPTQAGKSTLLAAGAARGAQVLTDDVLIMRNGSCLAGPRALDLRDDAAARLGSGERVRDAGRWRVALPPAPGERRLRGFVHLAWRPELAVERLAPQERLARLAVHRAKHRWPRDPSGLLGLARLPAIELSRPRGWDALPASVTLLAEALELELDYAELEPGRLALRRPGG
jgi:hypothetical protein